MGNVLTDRFGRPHDYLRVSVTDKCSLRCTYCMPEEGLAFFPDEAILSKEEIVTLVQHFSRLGITKVRLTGGEPLLRKDILEIISAIVALPKISDLSLTTNGLALQKLARPLKEAGVNRLNISLDTFDQERYRQVTRGGNLNRVLKGLETALRVGFDQIKLNVVVIQGQNDHELLDFLRFTFDNEVTVRFIEYMPIGGSTRTTWQEGYRGVDQVFALCEEKGWLVEPVSIDGNGPAKNYRIKGAQGRFGLIHPISCQFCASCNRLRVTADGYLKACLFWEDEVYLRSVIKDFALFENKVKQALMLKPENHEMALDQPESTFSEKPTWRHMSQIGG
mgnify:CR=1 FL=1